MTARRAPRPVAVTAGDANGIGPEVALRAASSFATPRRPVVLVGARPVWTAAARLLDLPAPPEIDTLETASFPPLSTWDPDMAPAPKIRPGRLARDSARHAYAAILAAVAAAQNRLVSAVVTAPINKEAFQLAGIPEPGHTELLARLTGARRYAMMLFGRRLRVVLATRHLPLSLVAKRLRASDIAESVSLLAEALPLMGLPRARIGVCALNPHAGDGGALGTEEKTLIAPEIRRLAKRGYSLEGPVPADAIFHRALAGDFDAVVAMYHDQGLGPLKMLSFDDGVNWTLGLPIIRTSPDHGTAFGIAWQNRASPSSTLSALRWAARLAARPNPWTTP